MATIEELELRELELARAEAAALSGLVEHLRGAAVSLPHGSPLALGLATGARRLEPWAQPEEVASTGRAALDTFLADIAQERRANG